MTPALLKQDACTEKCAAWYLAVHFHRAHLPVGRCRGRDGGPLCDEGDVLRNLPISRAQLCRRGPTDVITASTQLRIKWKLRTPVSHLRECLELCAISLDGQQRGGCAAKHVEPQWGGRWTLTAALHGTQTQTAAAQPSPPGGCTPAYTSASVKDGPAKYCVFCR